MRREERADEDARLRAVEATGLSNRADDTMDRLARLAARLLGAPVGLVSLVDDRRQFFPGQIGLPDPLSADRETPLTQSLCRTVVESGGILQIDDTNADPQWALHGARTVLGVASYLGAPLIDDQQRVLGALCAIGDRPRAWSEADRLTIADLSIAASSELQGRIAVRDATAARDEAFKARQAAEKAHARVRVMADVSEALDSSQDTTAAVARMLETIVDRYALWAFVVISAGDETALSIHARHRDSAKREVTTRLEAGGVNSLQDMPMTRSVLAGERHQIVLDTAEAVTARESGASPMLELLGVGPLAVVPMIHAGERLGVLGIARANDDAPFADIDLALARDLAHRTAISVQQSRAYARERQMAFELQHSLLPELPERTPFGVDAVYLAGAKHADVGGDWYDLIAIDDGSWIVTVGDVTGHNMRAAAAMGRIQGAMRLLAVNEVAPASIVDRISELSTMLLGELLATCQIVKLKPDAEGSWTADIVNAGHLPPIVGHPTGTANVVDVPADPLIGIRRAETHSTTSIRIEAGSTLLLYTDGLIEHRRQLIDDSLEHLRLATAGIAIDPIAGAMGRLVTDMKPSYTDDIAGIAIRF